MLKIMKENNPSFNVVDILKEEQLKLKETEPVKGTIKKKNESQKVAYMAEDIIPMIKFLNIQSRMGTIIESYDQIDWDLSYDKTNEVNTDLTRIEGALTNIEKVLEIELKEIMTYNKED